MSKDIKSSRKEQYLNNRRTLIELSQAVRIAVKEGAYDSVNEGLKESYIEQHPEIKEFKTFWQWKDEGATVRKGEKAFLIWGQPRKGSQVPEGTNEPEEYKYWPICYLFANSQIYMPKEEETKSQAETELKPEFEPINGDDF